jgi:hypothetical protein
LFGSERSAGRGKRESRQCSRKRVEWFVSYLGGSEELLRVPIGNRGGLPPKVGAPGRERIEHLRWKSIPFDLPEGKLRERLASDASKVRAFLK